MRPYTYFVKHLPTGMKYYGSKYGKDADPTKFWIEGGYYTSSRKVKLLIEQYGVESFECRVTRVFETAEQALAHEYKFIEKVGAVKKADWLNENNGGEKFYNVGPDSEETRLKKSAMVRTPESNAKRSAALKGRPKHKNFGKILSEAQKNRPLDKEQARRNKIREKAIGRGHNQQTRDLLSSITKNRCWVKLGQESKPIWKNELEYYLSQGWKRGRVLKKKES
jgi:hypothetical protein